MQISTVADVRQAPPELLCLANASALIDALIQ
jgi:hypothetical protein